MTRTLGFRLLAATCFEELSAIKDKWGQRCAWVWKRLSKGEKAKIKTIAQTQQLKIEVESVGGEDEWDERF